MMYGDQLPEYQSQRWFRVAIGSTIVTLFLLGIIWYLTHRPRPLPQIYVPSIHGELIGRVQPVQGLADIPDLELRHILDEYITKAFSISPIYEENIQHQRSVADMTAGQATPMMTSFWNANNPVALGQKYSQTVEIRSRLKAAEEGVYNYHWKLTRRSLSDDTVTVSYWWGQFQVVHAAPTETDDLGVYVIGFQYGGEQE